MNNFQLLQNCWKWFYTFPFLHDMLLPIILWHLTHHSHTSSLTPSKNVVVHSHFQSFFLRHTNNTITIIIFLIQVKYILVFCHTKNKKKTNLQFLISEDIYAFHIWYVMFFELYNKQKTTWERKSEGLMKYLVASLEKLFGHVIS